MTRFKLNARLFGGFGIFLIVAILLVPMYIGILESGVGEIPTTVIQVEMGDIPVTLPNNPFAFGVGALIVFFVLLFLIRLELRRKKR